MPYKNVKGLLIDAAKYPAAIEAMLPAGAPVISTMLIDTAGKIPATVPDFPMEIPDLPAVPKLPELPVGAGLGRRYVTGAEVIPLQREEVIIITPGAVPILEEIVS